MSDLIDRQNMNDAPNVESTQMNYTTTARTAKRRWERAFQKWSDEHGMGANNTTGYGCCGYGSMCEWCDDPSYGNPCVRALNAMLREKGITINYEIQTFEGIW